MPKWFSQARDAQRKVVLKSVSKHQFHENCCATWLFSNPCDSTAIWRKIESNMVGGCGSNVKLPKCRFEYLSLFKSNGRCVLSLSGLITEKPEVSYSCLMDKGNRVSRPIERVLFHLLISRAFLKAFDLTIIIGGIVPTQSKHCWYCAFILNIAHLLTLIANIVTHSHNIVQFSFWRLTAAKQDLLLNFP